MIRLLELGHKFDDPKIVPKDYDPWSDPLFVDFGSKSEPDAWFCATPGCDVWNRYVKEFKSHFCEPLMIYNAVQALDALLQIL